VDVPDAEDAYADLAEHVPLLGDAVRRARVVDEARHVALVRGVDHLFGRNAHQVRARRFLEFYKYAVLDDPALSLP